MFRTITLVLVTGALMLVAIRVQHAQTRSGASLTTTFVSLGNNANALLVEPAAPDAVRGRFAVLVTHPERLNNFNYFLGEELPKRGYRVLLMNYYGPEQTYDEFFPPIAAAITHLRGLAGVQRVVFAMHSTGGPELTAYQDVAENGPQACRGPERVYPCRARNLEHLPKADGLLLLDVNAGAPERTIAIDPAITGRRPRQRNAELDMFDPRNGFDPATKSASYSPEFVRAFTKAQGARNNQLIDEASARLAQIEKGEGDYTDDEPFVVPGSSRQVNGARLELADTRLLSKTHAPHRLLKADGTMPTEIVRSATPPQARPQDQDRFEATTQNVTVRHYLSFFALRTTADYAIGDNTIAGIQWRSTPNSVPGNVEGIRAPTLVIAGTCAPHMVLSEIAFDRSAATDKAFVAVEGANHNFQPCKPDYGDTFARTFDYVDGWLTTPGRF